MTKNLVSVKIGNGEKVHYAEKDENGRVGSFGICGAGFVSTGFRRQSRSRVVDCSVDCKKCLDLATKIQAEG